MLVELLAVTTVAIGSTVFYIKRRNKKRLQSEPEVVLSLEKIKSFDYELSILRNDYITNSQVENLRAKYQDVCNAFAQSKYEKLTNVHINEFLTTYANLTMLIKEWNKQFVDSELVKHKTLFDNIAGKSLDNQQRTAVIVDEDSNLVLAGAGSGKTLTISGKVKYLVDTKNVNPNEILLISFTKKAAEEMQDRIARKLHIGVEVKTFHALGLDIIRHTFEEKYDVTKNGYLKNFIEDYFKKNSYSDKKQIQNFITFFSYYLNIPKDWEEFESLGECIEHHKNSDYETLKSKVENVEAEVLNTAAELKVNKITLQGEVVKSLEEVMIANFLYLNGVKYEYEKYYPYDTNEKYKKTYQPDFYLSDYNIYIEHFGITEDYRTPWLTAIEETKYIEGIHWKRNLHKTNKTKLIETYSYYNRDGILLTELEKKLKSIGVKFVDADYTAIYKKVFNDTNDKYFSEFIKLVSTFIKLFKSNGYNANTFISLYQKAEQQRSFFLSERYRLFLSIVYPIYIEYQSSLKTTSHIDFDDMINLATDSIRQGRGVYNYKYIIIDEYQDIALSRFNLIKELKNRTHAKLLCVGDDWQSIYRFAGSDLTLFTNFGKHLGYYELLRIEKTYRNSQELIDIAGKFVMQNPKQLRKNLLSDKHHSNPLRIVGYSTDLLLTVAKVINEIVEKFGPEADITILGRNNFDIDAFKDKKDYVVTDNELTYIPYPKLKLKYMTTHKSKGLEADNVIVINLENKLLGFPNKISDDPLLSMVLTDQDGYPFSEERRLFYVAITRTKYTTFLIVPDKTQSVFVSELIRKFGVDYEFDSTNREKSIQSNPNCPVCKTGRLIIRENSNNHTLFLGCSNYPSCETTLKDIEIINHQIKCNRCGGYMTKIPGKYGAFYGCTNYPNCENKLPIKNINQK
jgi:DNA helicase-4